VLQHQTFLEHFKQKMSSNFTKVNGWHLSGESVNTLYLELSDKITNKILFLSLSFINVNMKKCNTYIHSFIINTLKFYLGGSVAYEYFVHNVSLVQHFLL
jgi:carboxypeptidase C (cathepsin A)